mgnify:CR=1 FL=1
MRTLDSFLNVMGNKQDYMPLFAQNAQQFVVLAQIELGVPRGKWLHHVQNFGFHAQGSGGINVEGEELDDGTQSSWQTEHASAS